MPMQAPTTVAFEGRGQGIQVGPVAEGKGTIRATATASAQEALPLSSNGLPYAVYWLTALTADVYFKLGVNGVSAAATDTNFDDVIPAGTKMAIYNVRERTHIAAITAAGSGSLVIAGCA